MAGGHHYLAKDRKHVVGTRIINIRDHRPHTHHWAGSPTTTLVDPWTIGYLSIPLMCDLRFDKSIRNVINWNGSGTTHR